MGNCPNTSNMENGIKTYISLSLSYLRVTKTLSYFIAKLKLDLFRTR